jgi:hypothetical protein
VASARSAPPGTAAYGDGPVVVPLARSTRLMMLAVYLGVVNAISRLYLRRSADG